MIKRRHDVEKFQPKIAFLFVTPLKKYKRERSSLDNPPLDGANGGIKRIEHQFSKGLKVSDGVNYLG
jgi:hypothetical protein